MKTKFKNISDNDISELLEMYCRMQQEFVIFAHVTEHVPESVYDAIERAKTAIQKEFNRREETK